LILSELHCFAGTTENLIAESTGDGTSLRDFIYLNGERIAMKIYGEQERISIRLASSSATHKCLKF